MPCLRYTWLDLMMEAHTYASIFDTFDCLGLCLDHICTTVVTAMSGSFSHLLLELPNAPGMLL